MLVIATALSGPPFDVDNRMKAKRILKIAASAFLVFAVLACMGLGVIFWKINSSLKEFSAAAQQAHPHPGDDIAALIDYVNSEDHSLHDRNHAVWAEVLLDGKGWQQVDPTGAGKVTCGTKYIPYFTTETGEMPILYVSMPQIEVIEPE